MLQPLNHCPDSQRPSCFTHLTQRPSSPISIPSTPTSDVSPSISVSASCFTSPLPAMSRLRSPSPLATSLSLAPLTLAERRRVDFIAPVRRGGYGPETNVSRFNRPRVCLQCYSYDSKRDLQKTTHSGSLKCTHVLYNTRSSYSRAATVICASALNARCSAEQTQTVTREAPTITHVPGKEKSPQLDDGGTGFPPRDDGDGGGGGGGGGGNWSGGFFFFGFLAFLGFLKDKESEGSYRDKRRR